LHEKSINGYSYFGGKYEEIWRVNFDQNEQILDYSYHLKGHDEYYKKAYKGFFIHIPEENKVIYKIVDSSNVAILTKYHATDSNGKINPNVVNLN